MGLGDTHQEREGQGTAMLKMMLLRKKNKQRRFRRAESESW